MSHNLTLELNDQVFTAIQQQAEAIGVAPAHLVETLLEQRFGQIFKPLQPEAEKQSARLKFEQHFGALSLEQPTSLGNESIDADLAREYANTHKDE